MSPALATRQIYWDVAGWQWMYVAFAVLVGVFALGVARRVEGWRRGRPEARRGDWRRLARYALLQGNVLRERDGWNHAVFYFSYLVLAGGTTVVLIDRDLGVPIMRGWFFLIYQSLALDLAGLAAVAAAGVFLWRRGGGAPAVPGQPAVPAVADIPPTRSAPETPSAPGTPAPPEAPAAFPAPPAIPMPGPSRARRPPRLARLRKPARLDTSATDRLMLWGFIAICATGFLLQALHIQATADPWAAWAPVGAALSLLLPGAAADRAIYPYLWWFHMALAFAWMAAIPWTKLAHAFIGAVNVYYGEHRPALATPDLEDPALERLGAAQVEDLTWKALVDLDACTECGRCQDACPAYAVGQPLSPKILILDMQRNLHAQPGGGPLVRGVVADETLWACTTCRACVEACPVGIEPFPKIVEMRRHLTMELAELPAGMAEATQSIETRGHPWRGAGGSRTDWAAGLDVRVLGPGDGCDVLYWVGCTAAFDPRAQRVARAFARLLLHAGVDFAILGEAESCSGDPARRIGHEYLYQQQAGTNVETLAARRFRRIVATCPHCLNTLRNEYPDLGGRYDVLHHTQLLQQLAADGSIPRLPDGALREPQGDAGSAVAFHDPCYLGRYNREFDAPRRLIGAAGLEVREMVRSRERSFCCGAGGGRVFADGGQARVNLERARQARATGAATIATACPFCLLMMEDGARGAAGDEGPQRVRDVAELLADAVFGEA